MIPHDIVRLSDRSITHRTTKNLMTNFIKRQNVSTELISCERVFYFDYRTNELFKYLMNNISRACQKTDEVLEMTVACPNVMNKLYSVLSCARGCCYTITTVTVIVNDSEGSTARFEELIFNSDWIAMWS